MWKSLLCKREVNLGCLCQSRVSIGTTINSRFYGPSLGSCLQIMIVSPAGALPPAGALSEAGAHSDAGALSDAGPPE